MGIRLPKIPQKTSNDFITGFAVPKPMAGLTNVDSVYRMQKTRPASILSRPSLINLDSATTNLTNTISSQISAQNIEKPTMPADIEAEQTQAPGALPIIPSADPIATLYNIGAIVLNIFGGQEQAKAEREAAEAKQKYYNDLATFEEKQSQMESYQLAVKSLQVGLEGEQIEGQIDVMAAAAGLTGQTLEDVKLSSAMSVTIDKELIKQASVYALKSGKQKAEMYRRAGRQAKEAGEMQATQTEIGTAFTTVGQIFGFKS